MTTKSELQSKNLSELHVLAAEAGVERFRMLPRAELIDALADGDSGSGGGGASPQRSREGGGNRSRGNRGGRGRGRGGDREPRGGGDREPRGGGDREPRGGGNREPRGGGDRKPRSAAAEKPASSEPSSHEAEETTVPDRTAATEEKPKRHRRRRRFGRRGGKTVRAQELLLPAAGARQVLIYGDSKETCTELLREVAADLSGGKGPDPVALLVDPSPEDLADWKREAPKAEIVSAGQERHAEDALAQAVRRAGGGEDVVFLIDSLTRVAEEFGGSKAAKELFDGGLAGGGSTGGSLTVIAAVVRAAD